MIASSLPARAGSYSIGVNRNVFIHLIALVWNVWVLSGTFDRRNTVTVGYYIPIRIKTENIQDSTSQKIFDLEKLVFYSY